jgi:hypothetical protein
VPKFYEWAPRAARYRDPATGRFVARETIRYGLDDVIRQSQNTITTASDDLRNGRIELADWVRVMQEEIKRTQLTGEALLRGGWAQLSPEDYARVADRVREQYEYLDGFMRDLRDGTIRTDGQFMNRARMYAAAARVGYHAGQQEQVLSVGYTEELNVLHPAEHCIECVECRNRGWVPIGTNPPVGTRKCLGNDVCTMRYR